MPGPRFLLDHLFTKRRLSAYVDGDLEPEQLRRVRRHLDDCEDCGRAERSLRRLVFGLRLLAGRQPPRLADDAVDRVRTDRAPRQYARRG